MSKLLNKQWWAKAGTRAIKTVAQTAIATIGTAAVIADVNWIMVASASGLAGLLSLLTSVAGLPEMEEDNDEFLDDDEDEFLESFYGDDVEGSDEK